MNVAILGRGRVGSSLYRSLEHDGTHEVTAMGRKPNLSALNDANVVILAVSDDAIESIAARIATELKPGTTVLHCAGARDVDELDACAARGAHVGVMHPLVSFPSKRRQPSLEGKTFVVHGSPRAIAMSRRIGKACGARVITAQAANPVYHAAAALVANGAAALAFVAVRLLEGLGVARRDAERSIGGLLESVGENVQSVGVPDALTGPVARGDSSTVDRHRRALRRVGRGALSTYDALLPVVLQNAEAAGLSRRRADEIRRIAKRR
ncbi:MAG: DUF2520 domain-containing protein [Myxococcales bacterium]|nr:DUF2520 domain-containing protein [Myxococcales bacterium]MDH3483648.1 DUF2520 domain-containing protein [Myxococcales bacterium]